MDVASACLARGDNDCVIRALQGREGIWFAGGYTLPFDSQETALRSALGIALRLRATSARARLLPGTGDPLDA